MAGNNGLRKRQSLQGWISEVLNDPDHDTPCCMLTLMHMQGAQEIEIHTARLGAGGKATSAESLAQLFQHKADAYAQDLPGPQTFNLIALFGSPNPLPGARHPFLVNGLVGELGENPNSGYLSTEQPGPTGLVAQAMRHGEMILQQAYRRQQVLDAYSTQLIERQSNIIETLMRENTDAFAIVKDMMMKQVVADDERERKRLEYERATKERAKWLQFAPALLNTLLGKEIFPQSTADTAIIEGVAEHLDPAAAMQVMQGLPPEVQGLLMNRLATVMQKKEEEAKAQTALATVPANADIELGSEGE